MTYPLPPNAVDLTFEFPATASTPNAIDLTFGATLGPPPGTVYPATMSGRFSLRASVAVNYNIGTWRGLSASTVVTNHRGLALGGTSRVHWDTAVKLDRQNLANFDEAADLLVQSAAAWSPTSKVSVNTDPAWGAVAVHTEVGTTAEWDKTPVKLSDAVAKWQKAENREGVRGGRFGLAKPTHRDNRVVWREALSATRVVDSPSNRAARVSNIFKVAPWQQAMILASYGGPMYLPPPPVVPPPDPVTTQDLKFCALYPQGGNPNNGLILVLGLNPCGAVTPDAPVYILPARFYMAVHSIEAFLLPSLTPIPIKNVSLAADADSTTWTFSANGPRSLFEALTPVGSDPATVKIVIDGMEWVFIVDRISRSEQFGQNSVAFSGRSVTAKIGAPYKLETSRTNTVAKNAQQIALDALAFTGVGLDWGIADWLVSAGAWSHTGTPLAAVQAVAEAAGGFILSHRSEPTVLVRHPYPILPGGIPGGPWNWEGAAGTFAADVELAPDVIIQQSIERQDFPLVNGVYVSGTNQGVQVHVYRQGTLGDKLGPMQVDPLITALAAANQRGYSILGRSGAKHNVQMTIPVLTGGSNPGVLDVGQLVQINESQPWRGRVRSVSVSADMASVRQSFTLERHLT